MTVAVVVIFATCIVAGTGFTHLSGIAMRTEERVFAGWIIGIVAFTLTAIVTTVVLFLIGFGLMTAFGFTTPEAVVTGVSSRGTNTQDTFSLLGFTASIEDAENRCSG